MLKSCKYCGRIHDRQYQCPKKPRSESVRKESAADEFRQKSHWKNHLSPKVKRDAGYLCEVCRDKGILTHEELSVHHIVPINEAAELADDESNLICVCSFCHEKAEKGEINRKFLKLLAMKRICGNC